MTSTNFNGAVDLVLAREAGFSNDPHDPGGATNFGIADAADGRKDGLIDLNRDGTGDVPPQQLTKLQAIEIYRRDYWNAMHCDELPSGLDLFAFDAAVQHGVKTATILLQRSANVVADGHIGRITLGAVVRRGVLAEYAAQRMQYYANLNHFKRFGLGWSRRLMAMYERAIALRSRL